MGVSGLWGLDRLLDSGGFVSLRTGALAGFWIVGAWGVSGLWGLDRLLDNRGLFCFRTLGSWQASR